MKTKSILSFLLAVSLCTGFSACSNDDDELAVKYPDTIVTPDDLSLIKSSLFQSNSDPTIEGAYCVLGDAINPDAPTEYYVGVESIKEARQIFLSYVNDRISRTEMDNNITLNLKDSNGKSQGNIYFAQKGEDGDSLIAEVTFSHHISFPELTKIVFIHNDFYASMGEYGKDTKVTIDNISSYLNENGAIQGSKVFSFYVNENNLNTGQMQVLELMSRYESSGAAPYIRIYLQDNEGLESKKTHYHYFTPKYTIGKKTETAYQQFRLPPYINYNGKHFNKIHIRMWIPNGCTLYIEDMRVILDSPYHSGNFGILFEALHGYAMYPKDSSLGFAGAAKAGFNVCTITPKMTADGVGVCFHDDSSIKDLLRYKDLTNIKTGSADDKPIWEFTYQDLVNRFVIKESSRAASTFSQCVVPTIDEFLRICSLTNMEACFSVHGGTGYDTSNYGTHKNSRKQAIANFQYIYDLAKKYNMLGRIWIKSGGAAASYARTVFGKDAGYIMIQGIDSNWDPLTQAKKLGLLPNNAVSAEESEYNLWLSFFLKATNRDAKMANALSEGFKLQIAGNPDGEEMKYFIEHGVKWFSVTEHISIGLNWW